MHYPLHDPVLEKAFILPQLWGLGVFQAAYRKCNWTLCHIQGSLHLEQLPKTQSGTIIEDNLRKVLEDERHKFGNTSTVGSQVSAVRCVIRCPDNKQVLRPNVIMNMINYIDNQAETEKVGSRTMNLQQPDIPYPFQPYLSPLYHVAPPLYLAMFLSFGRHSDKGIDALKKGVSSLSAHLHFLTGVVSPSSQPAGKDEVYEV